MLIMFIWDRSLIGILNHTETKRNSQYIQLISFYSKLLSLKFLVKAVFVRYKHFILKKLKFIQLSL